MESKEIKVKSSLDIKNSKKFFAALIYSAKTFFRNPKLYIVNFFMPILLIFIMYLVIVERKNGQVNGANIICYLFISNTILLFAMTSIFFEWKKTVLLRQTKNYQYSHFVIDGSIYLIFLMVSAIGFTLNLFTLEMMDLAFKTNGMKDWTHHLSFSKCMGLFFALWLQFTFIFGLAKLLGWAFRSIYYMQSVVVGLIVWFLAFSNIVFDPSGYTVFAICLVQYFNPLNYFCWLSLYFYADAFSTISNYFLVNSYINQFLNFNNAYVLLVFTIVWAFAFSGGAFAIRYNNFSR